MMMMSILCNPRLSPIGSRYLAAGQKCEYYYYYWCGGGGNRMVKSLTIGHFPLSLNDSGQVVHTEA